MNVTKRPPDLADESPILDILKIPYAVLDTAQNVGDIAWS
jgi:hypothetical protein